MGTDVPAIAPLVLPAQTTESIGHGAEHGMDRGARTIGSAGRTRKDPDGRREVVGLPETIRPGFAESGAAAEQHPCPRPPVDHLDAGMQPLRFPDRNRPARAGSNGSTPEHEGEIVLDDADHQSGQDDTTECLDEGVARSAESWRHEFREREVSGAGGVGTERYREGEIQGVPGWRTYGTRLIARRSA